MNFEIKGTTALVFKSSIEIPEFFNSFKLIYPQIMLCNIIILMTNSQIKDAVFLDRIKEISKAHQRFKRSLVLVCSEAAPITHSDTLVFVPTLLEAHDLIEMDEMQRDLGFFK